MASNLRVDTILPSTGTTLGIGTASGTINFLGNSSINTTGVVTASNISVGSSVTASAFYGDGSQLTGISVDSTKIETGNTSVETSDTGSNGLVKVLVDGSEKVRINNQGQIGINTTSPDTFIHVGSATTNTHFLKFEADMGASTDRVFNIFGPDTANSTAPFTFQTGNGYLFKCDAEHSFEISSDRIVKINNGFGSLAPIYGVRAWVQGNSGTTNESGGLSSMSRVNTGRFQLNFATTMPDDNYAVGCLANNNYSDTSWFDSSETTSVRVYFYSNGSYQDPSEWSAWVIR